MELYAEGEALAVLEKVADDLPALLIVSQASLHKDGKGETATERQDLTITVKTATGEKCERCWMYSETVGKDAEHPTLCTRCAGVLK